MDDDCDLAETKLSVKPDAANVVSFTSPPIGSSSFITPNFGNGGISGSIMLD